MEAISLKLDERMLTNIDTSIKRNNYSTRTEFIRSAIREKLDELKREKLIEEFMKYKGKSKIKTTYAENRKTREIALKELVKKRGWKL